MKQRWKFLSALGLSFSAIWAFNASMFAPNSDSTLSILSHRGMHQAFDMRGVQNDTCTASRMLPPVHGFMENSLPSMQAAIEAGADIIELDIHPTTDGEFAVFHDWTLDCRTNGAGKTRDHSAADLRVLDIGHGYTADGGATYPFRGKFIGAMPMLGEVLTAFPDTQFFINIKSRSKSEGRELAAYLDARDINDDRVIVYGHQIPIEAFKFARPETLTLSKQQAKTCFKDYALTGWYANMPKACERTWVVVPENYRWAVWGWPHRFEDRLSAVGSRAVLMGPQTKARSNPAIDSVEQLSSVPKDFGGVVWTNRIEIIGPPLSERSD